MPYRHQPLMTDWFAMLQQQRFQGMPQTAFRIASAALVSLSLWAGPSLAKDPFRTTNPRPISTPTENAFRAFFEQGNYPATAKHLGQAEASEPMNTAMKASLVYLDWQGERDAQKKSSLLEQFRAYATATRNNAQGMVATDPLRGNLYLAVGHFLEAAYIVLKEGMVKGTPQGMGEVQKAFDYLKAAEAVDPNDPEFALVKGYIELLMALNLPFSSPTPAIERLQTYARPSYLADRGIALGYRDLNQPEKAMAAVDRALQLTPNNPELHYLKAQILVRQGNNRDSIPLFEKALTKSDQLPPVLVKQITRELNRTKKRLETTGK